MLPIDVIGWVMAHMWMSHVAEWHHHEITTPQTYILPSRLFNLSLFLSFFLPLPCIQSFLSREMEVRSQQVGRSCTSSFISKKVPSQPRKVLNSQKSSLKPTKIQLIALVAPRVGEQLFEHGAEVVALEHLYMGTSLSSSWIYTYT